MMMMMMMMMMEMEKEIEKKVDQHAYSPVCMLTKEPQMETAELSSKPVKM
jgi:hypothetical protein